MEIIKLNNKDLIENMLKQLPTIGFTSQDVEFDSSYFVAYMGENSVCQFHIKEIPGFLFGIWTTDILDIKTLNYPKNTELVIFTQYEAELNKFKPSRSGFVTPLNRCIDNVLGVDVVMWDFWKLEHILNFMKFSFFCFVLFCASCFPPHCITRIYNLNYNTSIGIKPPL